MVKRSTERPKAQGPRPKQEKVKRARKAAPKFSPSVAGAVRAALDKKAEDVVVLDLRKAGGFTEYWSAEGLVETPKVAAAPSSTLSTATTTSAKAPSDTAAGARAGGERAA